jgi:hypothetical protein
VLVLILILMLPAFGILVSSHIYILGGD